MANTTNFGWETPDDTDLVKDGALAMRTLGNAIDASMVDLKGGTTGQVLSKNSNTDMDFVWVTSDDANAIQNSIIAAKGDIIVGSANDTPAILSAPTEQGSTLVADSAASTGLRWQGNYAGAKNFFINGAMQIWQRGTSVANSTTAFGADRWRAYRNTTGATTSRQSSGLTGFQYCARVQRDSGNTATNSIDITYNMATEDAVKMAGQTMTVSFYARSGANFSAASSQVYVQAFTGTGTDQNAYAGYTGSATILNTNATISSTWTRYSYTLSPASTTTEFAFLVGFTPAGTAGANDYFEITGIQLEIGSVATAFQTATGTLQGELAACQRYFEKSYDIGTAPGTNTNVGLVQVNGTSDDGNNVALYIPYKVAKRGSVTHTFYTRSGTSGSWTYGKSGGGGDATANVVYSGNGSFLVYIGIGAAYTAGFMYGHYTASSEL